MASIPKPTSSILTIPTRLEITTFVAPLKGSQFQVIPEFAPDIIKSEQLGYRKKRAPDPPPRHTLTPEEVAQRQKCAEWFRLTLREMMSPRIGYMRLMTPDSSTGCLQAASSILTPGRTTTRSRE